MIKKLLSSIVLLVSAVSLASAQATIEAATSGEANDPNAPEISFVEEVHDFGTISFEGNGKVDFKFTNTGKSPLVISSAKGSCGCTVPSWPKEPI